MVMAEGPGGIKPAMSDAQVKKKQDADGRP
jgi:hypothetical protein